jgi:hypothetical protein
MGMEVDEDDGKKMVWLIFEDQASNWISAKTIRNLKDLRNLARRTMQGIPANFVIFSEGKPVNCLVSLPLHVVFYEFWSLKKHLLRSHVTW